MYLVLEKNRMIKIFSLVVLVLFVGVICCTNGKRNNEVVQTSSKTSNEKVVILDAGHGQPDRTEL